MLVKFHCFQIQKAEEEERKRQEAEREMEAKAEAEEVSKRTEEALSLSRQLVSVPKGWLLCHVYTCVPAGQGGGI